MKDNMLPFFPNKQNSEDLRNFYTEPFPKFEDKKPEAWHDYINFVKEKPTINILQKKTSANFVEAQRIQAKQFMGLG